MNLGSFQDSAAQLLHHSRLVKIPGHIAMHHSLVEGPAQPESITKARGCSLPYHILAPMKMCSLWALSVTTRHDSRDENMPAVCSQRFTHHASVRPKRYMKAQLYIASKMQQVPLQLIKNSCLPQCCSQHL